MLARCVLVTAIAACGPPPKPTTTPSDPALPAAALIVVAPDTATIDRLALVLAPLGGERLGLLRLGVAAPWSTAELAAHGIDGAAPLGVAITADGVVVHWARVATAGALRTAFDAAPGAERWTSGDAQLWRFGDDASAAVAVITASGTAAVITAGAPSTRDRTALAIAASALRITASPVPDSLALELDASFLIDLATTTEPGAFLSKLGDDLGRIRGAATARPDRIIVDVEVAPRAGTLAERMIAGARGGTGGAALARGPFALSTRLAPAEAAEVLTELGKRVGINAAFLLARSDKGSAALTGELAFGPGGVGVIAVDAQTAREGQSHTAAELAHPNGLVFGGRLSATGGFGLNLSFDVIAAPPPQFQRRPLADLVDENTDVPWSQTFRAARNDFEATSREAAIAASRLEDGHDAAVYQWHRSFDDALGAPFAPSGTGYRAHGEWRPPGGTIAALAATARKRFDELAPLETQYRTTHDAAVAARARAIEIRARDVAAWDRRPTP